MKIDFQDNKNITKYCLIGGSITIEDIKVVLPAYENYVYNPTKVRKVPQDSFENEPDLMPAANCNFAL